MLALGLGLGGPLAGITDLSPGLIAHVRQKWGVDGVDRVTAWHDFESHEPQHPHGFPDEAKLAHDTNAFWSRLPYQEDADTWGDANYWPTPIETLGIGHADCKAYSIGKYFTLKDLGVPVSKLRIVYVTVVADGLNEPHMVLAYYPTPDADPYILDNLTGSILHASDRPDLVPVYSFNDDDLWTAGSDTAVGSAGQIRLWRALLQKMAREQKY